MNFENQAQAETPSLRGSGGIAKAVTQQSVSVVEVISQQVREHEEQIANLKKLAALFEQNPAMLEAMDLMNRLRLGRFF